MGIIFLDIDGVLNSRLYYESPRYDYNKDSVDPLERKLSDIDPKSIEFLNDLIEKTGAKVVITSTWRRYYTIVELSELFKKRGFVGEILDKTPTCGSDCLRGNEILRWVKENETLIGRHYHEFNDYVILDDDSDMLYWQRNNFIVVDGYVGLTPNICYKAERVLKRG